jgi:primosomal protein N'
MRQTPLLIDNDDIKEGPIPTGALFTAVVPPLDGEFIYEYAPDLHPELKVGYVVQVPLGKRETHAYITSINSAKEAQTKNEMAARGKRIKAIPGSAATA